jgi:hypothetical protein
MNEKQIADPYRFRDEADRLARCVDAGSTLGEYYEKFISTDRPRLKVAEVFIRFFRNQSDLCLDDSYILWAGQNVLLMSPDMKGVLASFSADCNLHFKLASWCAKNSYRCSKFYNGRIYL